MQLQGAKRNARQGLTSSEKVLRAGGLAILCATNNGHTTSLPASSHTSCRRSQRVPGPPAEPCVKVQWQSKAGLRTRQPMSGVFLAPAPLCYEPWFALPAPDSTGLLLREVTRYPS